MALEREKASNASHTSERRALSRRSKELVIVIMILYLSFCLSLSHSLSGQTLDELSAQCLSFICSGEAVNQLSVKCPALLIWVENLSQSRDKAAQQGKADGTEKMTAL